jgi:hypothetical protein
MPWRAAQYGATRIEVLDASRCCECSSFAVLPLGHTSQQIDREELVAFLVEKSQKLSVDKDFVVAMDRLNQFALHMRQRERLAQVNAAAGFC